MKSNMLATALGRILPKTGRLLKLSIDDGRIMWTNYPQGKGWAIVKSDRVYGSIQWFANPIPARRPLGPDLSDYRTSGFQLYE